MKLFLNNSSKLLSFVLCLVITLTSVSAAGRYNISFAQLDTCDTYDIKDGGYAYKEFFMVHKLDNNNRGSNERLHLKFYVVTNMDAHILLSVTEHPRSYDRVYEIVLGAGGNTFSAIRTGMGTKRVSTNQDSKLLSVYEPTPIEIIQTKDGTLSVFLPGFKKEPLLEYSDSSPLIINYLSFSTFGSNSARWFFDCQFDGFSNEMERKVPEQSVEDKLLGTLLYQAPNKSQPKNLTEIMIGFQVRALSYEVSMAMLNTRVRLMLYWQDLRLSWEPTEYNGIEALSHPKLEIWTPDLMVLNGALDSQVDVMGDYKLRVYSNGIVRLLVTNLELSTWCVDTARNWPDEVVNCDIELGTRQTIPLNYDQLVPLLANEHINTLSAWTLAAVGISPVDKASNERFTPKGVLQAMAGDIAVEYTLQRNSQFYRQVFVMPLIACQVFIILSFLLRGYRRGALILVTLLLTAWGLMSLTKQATTHYVPSLMVAYQYIMRIATFCYLLHIAIMWLERYPPRATMPAWLLSLINLPSLRFVLCMRLGDASDYDRLQQQPWRQLAKLCNSLCFIAVNLSFILLDVLKVGVLAATRTEDN